MNGIILPDDFKEHIIIEFGETGADWLEAFPELLETCVRQWQLKNLKLSPHLSYNAILTGTSPIFGDVALKMSVPHREFFTECGYILHCMKAGPSQLKPAVRRCLAHDRKTHAMLLEWISPGNDLWTVAEFRERIRIGVGILASSPVPFEKGRSGLDIAGGFPAFREWMDRAYGKAREAGRGGEYLNGFWDYSYRLLSEVEAESDTAMLLHGDLHHANMLFDKERGWQVIDPKGVLGPAYMECGRFIRNQLWEIDERVKAGRLVMTEGETEKDRQLGILLESCAGAFRTGAAVILKCCCIDAALSSCWHLEGLMSPGLSAERTAEAEAECRFFWERLSSG